MLTGDVATLPNASASPLAAACSARAASSAASMPAVSFAVKVFAGATKADTPEPVVAAVLLATLLLNRLPIVPLNKLLIVPRALSILGKFVVRLPNPKPLVAISVLPGSCGMPSLARM